MATSILAWIQFDDNTPRGEQPFSNEASVWDLQSDFGLYGCKDYGFIAAISGVRNQTGMKPLIPLRGAPASSVLAITELKEEPSVGWLTHSEILACLKHFGIPTSELHRAVLNVLDVMKLLKDKYGDERVRLVFSISD